MRQCLFALSIRALAVSSLALLSGGAQANSGVDQLNVIDMTTNLDLGGDVIITTGFLHEIDLVSYEQPQIYVSFDDYETETIELPVSGWSGVVEVDMEDNPTLPFQNLSAYSDKYVETGRETRLSGFYTMRYQFDTNLPLRPYAGAGLGMVATDSDQETGGIFAGRATAGFDLTVGTDSALFAEYAFIKSGGVNLGTTTSGEFTGGSIPDTEHSIKFGFRRTF